MIDISEFSKYTREQIYEALVRFKEQYPATYKAFFLYELEKPFSPFDRQSFMFLSDKDMELFNREPAPLKVLVPVVIEEDEKDT